MARAATVLAAATVAMFLVTVAGAAGELAQKPGTAGCVSDDGTGGECQDGLALDAPRGVAVSSDGNQVYAVAEVADAISIFDRNVANGELAQKAGVAGCISETGTGGACQVGRALDAAFAITVSADGKNVYTAAAVSNAVGIFDREPVTGALTQKAMTAGCVSDDGSAGACQDGNALVSALDVTVSPDGKNVYAVGQTSNAIAIFDRNGSGALLQKAGAAGCVAETTADGCQDGKALVTPSAVAVSPDGRTIYTTAVFSDAVGIFDRNPTTGEMSPRLGALGCVSETGNGGTCVDGKALDVPLDVAVSPDGKSVYVASFNSNAIAIFDRDPATGALMQKTDTAGCISEDGSGGTCQDGTALERPVTVAVSPDGSSVYVGSGVPGNVPAALAIFDRDPSTGALVQKTGTAGCISETGSSGACQDGRALTVPNVITVSGDGKNMYVTATAVDAVAIFDRALPVAQPPPPPSPPPAPPPAPPARDTVAPTISGFAVAPSRVRRSRGSRFRFRLSERANAGILLERALPGRRVGRRCVAPTRRNRGRGRCTRFVRAGTLTLRNRPAGANNLAFRTRGRRLGAYRATITARDPAGNRSTSRRAAFRIVRR